jgi:hypothetical protein
MSITGIVAMVRLVTGSSGRDRCILLNVATQIALVPACSAHIHDRAVTAGCSCEFLPVAFIFFPLFMYSRVCVCVGLN